MTIAPPDEHALHAYVDGRLAPQQHAAVAAWLQAHPAPAARVAGCKHDAEALRAAHAGLAPEMGAMHSRLRRFAVACNNAVAPCLLWPTVACWHWAWVPDWPGSCMRAGSHANACRWPLPSPLIACSPMLARSRALRWTCSAVRSWNRGCARISAMPASCRICARKAIRCAVGNCCSHRKARPRCWCIACQLRALACICVHAADRCRPASAAMAVCWHNTGLKAIPHLHWSARRRRHACARSRRCCVTRDDPRSERCVRRSVTAALTALNFRNVAEASRTPSAGPVLRRRRGGQGGRCRSRRRRPDAPTAGRVPRSVPDTARR